MTSPSAGPASRQRLSVRVRGVVQGVGFRPYVHKLATTLGLAGLVGNDGDGVFAEVEGLAEAVAEFVRRLPEEAPPLAVVSSVTTTALPAAGDRGFTIVPSLLGPGRAGSPPLVPADTATCAACLAELFDPTDRRFRYPFVNCTACGPRFTIVTGAPYDRARTTMAGFAMCPPCAAEYEDPTDRRFHAEATCCADCGPRLRLVGRSGGDHVGEDHVGGDHMGGDQVGDPIAEATRRLGAGQVVAVKGLGGYHLAVAAGDEEAVARLRARKHREHKPFALLVADLAAAAALCDLDEPARRALTSPAAPIVLAPRRDGPGPGVAPSVAPGGRWVGVMLPSTPLHHLLARAVDGPLVLTSGNVSDEPIAHRDRDAFDRLAPLADAFLTHDRAIHARADDSVVRVAAGRVTPVRRSRGSVPAPIALPVPAPRPVLAVGAELKNTFCLAEGGRAFVSQHAGDLGNHEAFDAWESGIGHWCRLLGTRPEVVAHDLHPEYLSTKYALDREAAGGVELVAVQHHHAHVASCLADNGVDTTVIGLAFDGLGYGTDGGLWGGEVLVADLRDATRVGHLGPVPQPGGAAAVREPWRMAAAHVWSAFGRARAGAGPVPAGVAVAERHGADWDRVVALCRDPALTRPTTSVGRLFDAVAALAGVRDRAGYEGQAAIELEQQAAADPGPGPGPGGSDRYPLPVLDGEPLVIDPGPLVRAVVGDMASGVPAGVVGRRLHRALAAASVRACRRVRARTGLDTVALSGGVFQNALLLALVVPALQDAGFHVLTHRQVPPNDGGISLGQAAVAAARTKLRT